MNSIASFQHAGRLLSAERLVMRPGSENVYTRTINIATSQEKDAANGSQSTIKELCTITSHST